MSDIKKTLWAGMDIPIVGVTGAKGCGKTTWVSTIDPENTCMIDLEKSSQTMANMFQPEGSSITYGVPYKKRVDLYDEVLKMTKGRPPTSVDCFLWFKGFMESVKPGEFSVIAVDPISDIETGLQQWVYDNAELFGKTKIQYDKFGGLIHGDIAAVWKLILGVQSAKCQTFAFTTHEGLVWKDGKPVAGQTKAKGKPVLYELASLYLKLERKPGNDGTIPDVPTGYTTPVNNGKERLSLKQMKGGRLVTIQTVPPTIRNCDPETIREFIRNPVGLRKLREDEKPAPVDQRTDDERRDQKSNDLENAVRLEELRMERLRLAEKAAKSFGNKAAEVAASAPAKTAATATAVKEKAVATPKPAEVKKEEPAKAAPAEDVAAVETPKPVETVAAAVETVATPEPVKQEEVPFSPVSPAEAAPVQSPESAVTSEIWLTLKNQFATLQTADPSTYTDAVVRQSLEKQYKVSIIDGLTREQAEDLSGKLKGKLTKLGLDPLGTSAGKK